jgi:hypothetical protein
MLHAMYFHTLDDNTESQAGRKTIQVIDKTKGYFYTTTTESGLEVRVSRKLAEMILQMGPSTGVEQHEPWVWIAKWPDTTHSFLVATLPKPVIQFNAPAE